MIYSKEFGISDTEYDPTSNSNLSFHANLGILNLLLLMTF